MTSLVLNYWRIGTAIFIKPAIVVSAKSFRHVTLLFASFKFAIITSSFVAMHDHMLRMALNYHQILKPVVMPDSVYMMNYLGLFKIPSKFRFHYQPMLANKMIPLTRKWMPGAFFQNVTTGFLVNSSFVIWDYFKMFLSPLKITRLASCGLGIIWGHLSAVAAYASHISLILLSCGIYTTSLTHE